MVVTRFAPSPTGSMHIGGIRTALYAYAMAKKHKGKFLLRVEDTDRNRFVEGSEQEIRDMLKIYGLDYDSELRQSDRLPIYKEYAEKLIASGDAYYCFATKEEIAASRKEAEEAGISFKFRSPSRELPLSEAQTRIAAGEQYVIRQKLPQNEVVEFTDPVQGHMSFNTNDLDETVLLKSDGFPTYHLAVVVDDHLLEVTHVFRGVEWIPSVPKHVLLYKSFGWEAPIIVHLPVILDPEGGKLSKRKGSVSAKGFIDEGYLPEAILNFLMLLGWSAPIKYEHGAKEQELFTLTDFVEMFDIKDINKASPVFNRDKLIWFNQKYIQALSPDALFNKFSAWLQLQPGLEEFKQGIINTGPDFVQKALLLEQTRTKILSEIPAAIGFFFVHKGNVDLLATKHTKKLNPEVLTKFFSDILTFLNDKALDLNDLTHELWENFVRSHAETAGVSAGSLFMAMRLAITDSQFSPPLLEVMQILGKDEVVARIRKYL